MKKVGPDSRQSWIILGACSLISFITSGLLYGPTGVLYVAYQDTTQGTAKESSWVIALTPAMSVVGGPLGAALSTVLPIRAIVIMGVLLGSAGTAAGYLSLNFYVLLVTYGVLNGIGCALASTALSALINNAFEKYRETAMGVFCSVTPIAGIIMPILSQTLYDAYGLQGTLLILGGVYLNALVGAMLLMDTKMNSAGSDCFTRNELKVVKRRGQELQSMPPYQPVKQEDVSEDINANKIQQNDHVLSVEQPLKTEKNLPRLVRSYSISGTQKMANILKLRGFHLSNFTLVIGNFFCLIFTLITIDAGIQSGVKLNHSVHLMTIYSAAQLFGRLCLGWITEKKYVTRPAYFAMTHLIFSVICISYAFAKGFGVLALLSALAGIILGNLNPLSKVVYSDYLRKDQMVLAMYLSYFMVGVLAVIRSAFVGHIRDVYGNYANVYYFMACVSFLAAAVWIAEYLRQRRTMKNTCNWDAS